MKMETIQAKVSERLLSKASRLFTGTLEGRVIEILQNARRAGATEVRISNKDGLITVQDNGSGIDDFQKLLDLGGSGWDEKTEAGEDPAGVGLFSLAPREVEIKSGNRKVVIDKKGAANVMNDISSTGATLCFIADQDAGRKGLFVDFFGRKASTYKSIGLVALMNNLPIGVGYSRRVKNKFFFEIGISRIITPDEWADKDDPLKWVTAEYTKAIEDFVRDDPSQYWWLHRRWKHRPKEELAQSTQQ